MKPCGCAFCNDLRNIQPAKYIALEHEERRDINADDEFREFIAKAKEDKSFLMFAEDNVYVIKKCPRCGYVFSEEDYDSYD